MSETRREFVKKTVAGTIGLSMGAVGFSAASYRRIQGANDRILMSVIGIRGQGRGHMEKWGQLSSNRNILVKTLCDVDENLYAERVALMEEHQGSKPGTEWDMRKVFEDKDIDAVSFATPNHWHALGTIWASQAGKHVYVEKPCTHNIYEGRKMIEAARKNNTIVQVGFQNRSISNIMEAMDFLHKGGIGDVYLAKGLCYKPRDSFGIAPDSQPPAGLHYDMWLGPAPQRAYNEKRVHYNWHWHWDTGNGDTGNQGPHQFDIARWGLNKNEHPVKISSFGGIYGIDPKECSQETPNTQTSLFKYDDGKMLEFETRGRYTCGESVLDIKIGNIFLGTEGWMAINGSTWVAFKKREKEPFAGSGMESSETEKKNSAYLAAPGGTEHYANFIDAIRSGKYQDLNCDIDVGYYSSALPIIANISYRLNRELSFKGDSEKFVKDKEADRMLTRDYRDPYLLPKV